MDHVTARWKGVPFLERLTQGMPAFAVDCLGARSCSELSPQICVLTMIYYNILCYTFIHFDVLE